MTNSKNEATDFVRAGTSVFEYTRPWAGERISRPTFSTAETTSRRDFASAGKTAAHWNETHGSGQDRRERSLAPSRKPNANCRGKTRQHSRDVPAHLLRLPPGENHFCVPYAVVPSRGWHSTQQDRERNFGFYECLNKSSTALAPRVIFENLIHKQANTHADHRHLTICCALCSALPQSRGRLGQSTAAPRPWGSVQLLGAR